LEISPQLRLVIEEYVSSQYWRLPFNSQSSHTKDLEIGNLSTLIEQEQDEAHMFRKSRIPNGGIKCVGVY